MKFAILIDFLLLEHLEATAGLLAGLISVLLCLLEERGLKRGIEMVEQLVGGADRTHTTFIKFATLCGRGSWLSETITIVTPKITNSKP